MRLVFLGTAGAGGVPGRAQNCILAEASRLRLLLDAGPGCGSRLLEAGLDACSIDYVYVTHLHLDHWAGLFDLAVQAAARGCEPPIVAAAGEVAEEAAARLTPLLPRSTRNRMEPRPLKETSLAGILEPVAMRHSVPSYGALLRAEGKLVLYTSDTAPHSSLEAHATAVDIVIAEATMPPGLEEAAETTGHMTLGQALQLRRVMRPGALLVLTHWSPASLEAWRKTAAPSGVAAASDHLEILV